jgi:ComF family protein
MGGLNVKNTIVERVLQIIAPHPCFGCGKVGVILCEDCKYDIINEPFLGCILCGKPIRGGICQDHITSIKRAFTVSQRSGSLEETINGLKFHHTKAAARSLAELMDEYLPHLPSDIEIVPIPTVRSHIRQRGYDQVRLIAYHLSGLRKLPIHFYLNRVTNTTQHTVGKRKRQIQAEQAFAITPKAEVAGKTLLLIDDIVTTGSTLQAAADLLSKAGAVVWVATLAYQPLD